MKTIITAGLLVSTIAAAWLGLMTIPCCPFSAFIGAYVVTGLLAIATHDYWRSVRRRPPCPVKPIARSTEIRNPDTWTCRTFSA